MAEQNEGFLNELGLGRVDEQAAYDRALNRNRISSRQKVGQNSGLFIASLAEAIKAKRAGGEFDYKAARDKVRDRIVEQGAGLGRGELATRREIRDEFSRRNFGDMTDYDNRIKAAQFVAKRARQNENHTALNAALAQIGSLTEEKAQYEGLLARNAGQVASNTERMATTGWDVSGEKPKMVGGMRTMEKLEDGRYHAGMRTPEGFRPFSETFLPEDPNVGARSYNNKGLDERLRLAVGGTYVAETKNLTQSNFRNLALTNRMMVNIEEWGDSATTMIGAAGRMTAEANSAINNLKGFVGLLSGASEAEWERGGTFQDAEGRWQRRSTKETWHQRAADETDPFWNMLPEGFREKGQQATEFRAHIMDLAYMAARLAEPSNRGLSDRDIESALVRIAGSLNDPAALKQRIAEMAAEGMMDLQNRMDGLRGTVKDYKDQTDEETNAQIIQLVGGDAYPKLLKQFDKFLDRHNLVADYDSYTVRSRGAVEAPDADAENFGWTREKLDAMTTAEFDAVMERGGPEAAYVLEQLGD